MLVNAHSHFMSSTLSNFSLNIKQHSYLYLSTFLYLRCFRRVPQLWLSTFCIPINQRVSISNRWQRQIMHRQKVSYRTPIVSILFFSSSFSSGHVYIEDPSFFSIPLSCCFSPKGGPFFALYGWSIVKYVYCHLNIFVIVRRSMIGTFLSSVISLVILCNCDDLTDAATFPSRSNSLSTRTPVVYNNLSKTIFHTFEAFARRLITD